MEETCEELEARADGYKLFELDPIHWSEDEIADATATWEKYMRALAADRAAEWARTPRLRRAWLWTEYYWGKWVVQRIDNFRYWLAEKIHP